MARLDRYLPNRAGMRALAKSTGVKAMLEHRAGRVSSVAQSGYDSNPPHTGRVDVTVRDDSDSDRARVAVVAEHPAAMAIEHDRRVLGGAIDGAR